jgi:hypothetical protein
MQGVLRMGQEIEVRPGIVTKDASGAIKCIPIFSRIVSLFAEQNELQYAVPGGLIGVGTTVDPTLTRADRLVGQVRGSPEGSGGNGGVGWGDLEGERLMGLDTSDGPLLWASLGWQRGSAMLDCNSLCGKINQQQWKAGL